MPLSSGTMLGPYEIQAAIGAGGMGEVYRARDTRLERTVAIKVLPAAFSHRPDLRKRLEREARTLSSLSPSHLHPLRHWPSRRRRFSRHGVRRGRNLGTAAVTRCAPDRASP